MERLAMMGGARAVPRGTPVPRWPTVTDTERAAVLAVLDSGVFTAASRSGNEITRLEQAWAQRCGVAHCIGVANGTVAITAALAAVGVGPGDEVVVPALSFVASALAVLHTGATPVFVDIDPVTFCLDPAGFAAAVGPATRAVLPVHLHGLPADLDEITEVADRHGIAVIEDAAQAHGARYRGRTVGGLGAAAAFSLNMTKNLPTCGEGGLITTDDPELADRIRLLSQFGERLDAGPRRYVSTVAGWNAKLSAVNAAFTLAQLDRFDRTTAARHDNVTRFLARLGGLPGVVVPTGPPDRDHAWHLLRIRFDPAAAGSALTPGRFRAAVQRALRAEGVPAGHYQSAPLPDQPMFTEPGPGKWLRAVPVTAGGPGRYPVTRAVIEDSVVLQKVHLAPDAGPLLDRYADAFTKVWSNLPFIDQIGHNLPYHPPWSPA
jgi:perosamine synthetase